jgi:hypothetical protein
MESFFMYYMAVFGLKIIFIKYLKAVINIMKIL